MKRRLVVFAVLLFAISFSAFPARAASGLISVSDVGGGICQATFVNVPLQVTSNFPVPTPFTEIRTLNGATVATISGTQGAGPMSYLGVFGASFAAQSFPYTFQDVATFPQDTIRITAVCNAAGAVPIVTIDYGGGAFWDPGDDRLNRDAGQPAALYCRNGGDVQVWQVNAFTSRGTLALIITKAEIAKVKDSHPAKNTLIKVSKDGKFKLYYLPGSDELSFITTYLNSDKQYAFVFKACS